MNQKRTFLYILLPCFFLLLSNTIQAQRLTGKKVARLVERSSVLQDHYTGFALYEQQSNKLIYELNANKPAIPASNTKLFTLYTAMQMLGDSIPGIKYVVRNDSLIFWGTGDPSMLHPDLKSTKIYDFLKNSEKKLFFSNSNGSSSITGSAIYQIPEVSFPVVGNTALAYKGSDGKLHIKPAFLETLLRQDTSFHPRTFSVRREEYSNEFYYPAMPLPDNFSQTLYLVPGAQLTADLLSDTLKIPVQVYNLQLQEDAKTVYSVRSDSLYRRMMLPSDNYLAEQILLLCSSTLPGKLSVDSAIAYSRKNLLNDLPDGFQWRDGSGLSRYNLFSPRSIIKILTKISSASGDEQRTLNLFPAGGISGTLRTAYKTDNGIPFVWAKTGTLSNVHIQGGYLVTRKGKKLLFSFMNNHFLIPTADIRNEMVRIMTEIHNKY